MQFKGVEMAEEGSIVTVRTRYMERARPMTSKPGPGGVSLSAAEVGDGFWHTDVGG